MSKTIAITGATGAQGGGVFNVMINTPGWKVRAITRYPNGEKAKALAAQGAEVVQANFDDEVSIAKAFEGVHAVFAVTNFWEHLFTGKSQDESGRAEEEQAMKLASAAAKSSTVEHYVWSTLPGALEMSRGKAKCAHLDYKAHVDARIKKDFPELAKKTTFLFFGCYPSNFAFLPLTRPFEVPGSGGKYLLLLPTPASAKIPIAGDMTLNPGIWVRQILANPSLSRGRYASVATELLTWGEFLAFWSKVTGKDAQYVEAEYEGYCKLWGVGGAELADQLKFGELVEDWNEGVDMVGMEELGIKREDVRGCQEAFEGLKQFLL